MNTVYAVEETFCDGIDYSRRVVSLWSSEDKALLAIKEYDEFNSVHSVHGADDITYEVVPWEVG